VIWEARDRLGQARPGGRDGVRGLCGLRQLQRQRAAPRRPARAARLHAVLRGGQARRQARRGSAKAAERDGRPFPIVIDTADGATFPWAWYFRHLQGSYVDLSAPGSAITPQTAAVILTEGSRNAQTAALRDLRGREFPFRVWWVRDYGAMSPGNWARWLLKREVWNPTGGMPEWLYERPGA
jgi:hypothetical protein